MKINVIKHPRDLEQQIVIRLEEKLSDHNKIALFLSGGSWIKIYNQIVPIIKDYKGELIVGLVDERYSPNVDYQDSNFFQIDSQTEIFKLPNVKVLKILTGQEVVAEVENYEKELKPIFEGDYFKIALLGIGEDSHTAGILPNENKAEF